MAGFVAQHTALKRSVRHLQFVAMHFRRTRKNIRTSHSSEVGHFRKSPLLTLRSAVQPRTDIADRAALEQASINAGLRPLDGNSADHLRIEGCRPNAADAARDNRIDLV